MFSRVILVYYAVWVIENEYLLTTTGGIWTVRLPVAVVPSGAVAETVRVKLVDVSVVPTVATTLVPSGEGARVTLVSSTVHTGAVEGGVGEG